MMNKTTPSWHPERGNQSASWRTRNRSARAGALSLSLSCVCLIVLAACGRSAGAVATPTATPRLPASLYVVGRDSSDGNDLLSALSADDGQKRWSTPLSGGPRGQPVVADGVVYVGSELGHIKSGPGGLTAMRAQDGKQLWQDELGPCATPIVADGALYTSTAAGVYAIRSTDGHILWQLQSSSLSPQLQPSSLSQQWSNAPQLALTQGRLYAAVGGVTTTLYALRPSDGTILWRYSPSIVVNEVLVNLVVRSSNVYLSTSTTLYALRAADGTLAWSMLVSPTWADWRNMAITNDAVYAVAGPDGYCTSAGTPLPQASTVTARRASNGVVLWTAHFDGAPLLHVMATASAVYLDMQTATLSCPLNPMEDPFTYTPTADTIFALSGASGSVLWHFALQAPWHFVAMQPADSTLYVASSTVNSSTDPSARGKLYAFAADSGMQLWRHDLGYPSGFVVAPSAIYVIEETDSRDRSILSAVRRSDGAALWTAPETPASGIPDLVVSG